MAHHVVENATALERALPEPRHVRSAVLFSGAGEIRPAGERSASRPDQLFAACDLRREELILEVPRIEPDTLCQTRDGPRFGDIPREWFLACESEQLTVSVPNRRYDLFDVGDARLVGAAEPDCVDARVCDHRADRSVRFCVAHLESTCQCRSRRRVSRIRAPDAEHVGVTDSGE